MQEITTVDALNGILEKAGDAFLLLFKHSTVCPVSTRAYSQVKTYLENETTLPLYLVKVIESRPVSNEIAARFSVTHQSPQVLLVRDGEALWKTSHGAITAKAIQQAVVEQTGE